MTELTLIKREERYHGRIIDLIVDTVEYPSGAPSVREIARHPGGAVVVPYLPDGTILLVKQFRYPLGRHIIELPAGKLNPGEDPAVAARRELEEETGWSAGRLERLTVLYSTPGFCDEVLHLFTATDLQPTATGPRREEGERTMTLVRATVDEALAMIDRGEIEDAKTVAGILLSLRRRTAGKG